MDNYQIRVGAISLKDKVHQVAADLAATKVSSGNQRTVLAKIMNATKEKSMASRPEALAQWPMIKPDAPVNLKASGDERFNRVARGIISAVFKGTDLAALYDAMENATEDCSTKEMVDRLAPC